ncbi:hypothetical protein MRX96_004875 [Rhipicephalus microplus]
MPIARPDNLPEELWPQPSTSSTCLENNQPGPSNAAPTEGKASASSKVARVTDAVSVAPEDDERVSGAEASTDGQSTTDGDDKGCGGAVAATVLRCPPRPRQYRSKSAVSTDPRSPYYTSQGIQNNEAVRRSPSVSCVLDAIRREAQEGGEVPGVSKAALEKPSVSTIRQHYYPEGGWGVGGVRMRAAGANAHARRAGSLRTAPDRHPATVPRRRRRLHLARRYGICELRLEGSHCCYGRSVH